MANWRESFRHKPIEFRAPPPSPQASGRRSSVANDEILTEFLHHTLRVPDLVLPDRVSPRQKSNIQNLPKLDYKLLDSLANNHNITETFDAIFQTGCFELVNHGISDQLIRSVADSGAGIFELSPEKKAFMSRSSDRLYGFVEFNGDEKETSEEFIWCRDDALRSKMEAIWPLHYSNLSKNIEILTSDVEKIAGIILEFLFKNTPWKSGSGDDEISAGSVCYLYRHHQDPNRIPNDDQYANSLRYDVIRMMIRGSEHSHTLCLHVCNGSSEFHVYSKRELILTRVRITSHSKKGWASFSTEKDAIVITIGDQLQTLSGGEHKHVTGSPIFKKDDEHISMAFFYSPPHMPITKEEENKNTTISLGQQALVVLLLTLFYKCYIYVCN